MIPISYNLRSLMVRKTTTVASALGIALVVFVLAASQMLASGIRNTMLKSGSPASAVVLRKGADAELSSSIEQRFVGQILAAPGTRRNNAGAPLGAGELMVVILLGKADNPD